MPNIERITSEALRGAEILLIVDPGVFGVGETYSFSFFAVLSEGDFSEDRRTAPLESAVFGVDGDLIDTLELGGRGSGLSRLDRLI